MDMQTCILGQCPLHNFQIKTHLFLSEQVATPICIILAFHEMGLAFIVFSGFGLKPCAPWDLIEASMISHYQPELNSDEV